ncbi:MAG: UbiA family prenyltransferase [Oligoflexia bacterium]|nr:UbiA family prenyltransferase [Oligoflexia bacterium]
MSEFSERKTSHSQRPLCVDLDGTLIHTDMLFESLFGVLKTSPLKLLTLPFVLLRGRARLKRELASSYQFDPSLLPYREDLLTFIRNERAQGRPIYLSTASDQLIAAKIAEHVGVFDGVLASDGSRNNKAASKAEALAQQFGERGFDYAGDSRADLSVWRRAEGAVLVGDANRHSSAQVEEQRIVGRFPNPPRRVAKTVLKAIRVHQWVKNLLLFLPLILAHRAADALPLSHVLVGFFSFCFCSSSVYVLNDLLDLESDRHHHSKRNRPFASGVLSIGFGLVAVPSLLLSSLALALLIPPQFLAVLAGYFAVTLAYSLRLKQIVLVDILTLAALYTVRIIAGGAAAGVAVSEWLLAFSMFFFMSLACVKRYSELLILRQHNKQEAKGRGYVASDLEQIGQFGSAAGYLSVLVLALYVNSHDVSALYSRPQVLWLVCPLLLYWISRIWLIAHRGKLHEDPIVFAIHDKVSYVVGLLAVFIMIAAIQ